MKKCAVFYNLNKKQVLEFKDELNSYLENKSISIVNENNLNEADFAIVLGGDGTLLHAGQKLINNDIPVLAINMGSLGFLTETKREEAFPMIDELLQKNYKIEKRYFLELEIDGKIFYALNDVVVSKCGMVARMVRVDVYINNEYLNTYRADGVIISSPTGSTAYSLSAGGPILNSSLNAMVITPIAPHTLNARSLVVSGGDNISIKLPDKDSEVGFMIDGQENEFVRNTDSVNITMSKKYLKLIKSPSRSYYEVLRQKLKWSTTLV